MVRNRAIDILRFLGPLLITNSHMDLIYPNSFYATGGALGDAIFFFISGFTLNFTKYTTVFEWFKRRLYRIYLVVFSVALFHEVLSLNDRTIVDTILNGGGWFVKCLLIYYIVFLLVRERSIKFLLGLIITVYFVSVIYMFFAEENFSIYGGTYFKWLHFLVPFLLGVLNFRVFHLLKFRRNSWAIAMVLFIGYYGLLYLSGLNVQFWFITSALSIVVLSALVNILFVCALGSENIFSTRFVKLIIMTVGSIALEIYLVQDPLIKYNFTENQYFNVGIVWVVIFTCAYLVKVIANILASNRLSWDIFKVY